MLSQDRISKLAALSLFLSAIELFIPRFVPFFRLGLSNIPVLMALSLDFKSFMLLCLLKGIGTSYTAGNIFSIFAAISISQSIVSGLVMYGTKRMLSGRVSIYGISIAGALTSTIVQILLASAYAGSGTMAFLPLMLVLSFPSALLTAYLSKKMPEPETIPSPDVEESPVQHLYIIMMVLSGAAMMMTENPVVLLPSVASAFIFQRSAGRKIKILPHIAMLSFMIISSLLVPHGKVILTLLSFPVTEGALADGLSRGLRLSGGIALSQAFSMIIRPGKGLIGKTMKTFAMLLSSLRDTHGSPLERFQKAVRNADPSFNEKSRINVPAFTTISFSCLIIAFAIIDCIFF